MQRSVAGIYSYCIRLVRLIIVPAASCKQLMIGGLLREARPIKYVADD